MELPQPLEASREQQITREIGQTQQSLARRSAGAMSTHISTRSQRRDQSDVEMQDQSRNSEAKLRGHAKSI